MAVIVLSGNCASLYTVFAQNQPDDFLHGFTGELSTEENGARIQWELPGAADELPEAGVLFAAWEKVPLDGYLLPLQTFTLQAPLDAEIRVELEPVESILWTEEVPLAELPEMRSPTGETIPAPVVTEELRLPESPLFILREGQQRGERFVIIALSPFYADSTDADSSNSESTQPAVRMATKINGSISPASWIAPQDDPLAVQLESPLLVAEKSQPASPLSTPSPTLIPDVAITTSPPTEPAAANTTPNTLPPTRNLNVIGALAFAIVLAGALGLFLRRRS